MATLNPNAGLSGYMMVAGVPLHPGVRLGVTLEREGITQQQLADATGLSRFRVNSIINGRRAMTPASAVLIGAALGTSAESWISQQTRYDLYEARCGLIDAVENIERIR
jgi:addiction module HigA family antidote